MLRGHSLNNTESEVMSTRTVSLGVPASPIDYSDDSDDPAALPDAILQMPFVIDSFPFSTWVFSDWSSRFHEHSTGYFHTALFLLSSKATAGSSLFLTGLSTTILPRYICLVRQDSFIDVGSKAPSPVCRSILLDELLPVVCSLPTTCISQFQ